MARYIFKGILLLHLIISFGFCGWYIFFDGYLGFGLGDLFYFIPISIITLMSIILAVFANKMLIHWRIFFGILMIVFDISIIRLFLSTL
jgi:hypothetical protein